jgi:hypothetical protein
LARVCFTQSVEFSDHQFQRVRMRATEMHHSRLCAILIDCKTSDVDQAARFWGEALGRSVDSDHPSSRGNCRMLETPPDEPIVEIQRVDHESLVHIDVETDDIPAEAGRLGKLGAKVVDRLGALGGDASADRPTLLRRTGTASRLPEECQPQSPLAFSSVCGQCLPLVRERSKVQSVPAAPTKSHWAIGLFSDGARNPADRRGDQLWLRPSASRDH